MGLPSILNPLKGSSGFGKLGSMLQTSVGMGANTTSPIGVDFGAGSLKLLQIDNTDTPKLLAAAAMDTPMELLADNRKRIDFQLEALPKLLKKAGFKGRRAVCAIPAWRTTCKHLQFNRETGVPIAALVEAAIAQQMGVDPNSLVYRFLEVSAIDKPGKVDVVLISVPREVVNQVMHGLTAARLDPVGIHSEFMATLRAFDYIHRRDGDVLLNTLYLDIGSTTTKLLISHGRELAFTRMIGVGGYDLDVLIAKQLAITEGEARRMRLDTDLQAPPLVSPNPGPFNPSPPPAKLDEHGKPIEERRNAGVPVGFMGDVMNLPKISVGPAGTDLREPLETITDEVRMSVRYHASQFPTRKVERVVFIGGESRHRGLVQHIARTLRLPAQIADPLARLARSGDEPVIGVDLKQAQPGWTVAVGLCLTPTDI
jgi:type IV pilus assembly protein PilM